MGSMSYCQFRNGAEEMTGILGKLIHRQVTDWSDDEVRAVQHIFKLAHSIAEMEEDIMDFIEELQDDDDKPHCETGCSQCIPPDAF